MSHIKWVVSGGGPLICMTARQKECWGGVFKLTVKDDDAKNDYDRACRAKKYVETISVDEGTALIIGDEPLDTSFWWSENGTMYLLRVWACEVDTDFEAIMRALPPDVFDNPTETMEFTITAPDLILFDSAEEGRSVADEASSASIEPGHYQILTQTYDPDPECSLILHRFDRIG